MLRHASVQVDQGLAALAGGNSRACAARYHGRPSWSARSTRSLVRLPPFLAGRTSRARVLAPMLLPAWWPNSPRPIAGVTRGRGKQWCVQIFFMHAGMIGHMVPRGIDRSGGLGSLNPPPPEGVREAPAARP